jgi:hypothetical protein
VGLDSMGVQRHDESGPFNNNISQSTCMIEALRWGEAGLVFPEHFLPLAVFPLMSKRDVLERI